MNKITKRLSFVLVTVMLFTVFAPSVLAMEETDNRLHTILVIVNEDTIISVPIVDYMKALNAQNALYNYLKGENEQPIVYGVSSGYKYMKMADFMKALNLNEGDISEAIETAEALTEEELAKVYVIVGDVEEGEEPELEPILGPQIIATYRPTFLQTFGFVSIEVSNLEAAAKFSVVFHYSDDEDGSQNIDETEIVNIGEEAGVIFYDPKQYNTIDIKIYDVDENLIHTFEDVEPIVEQSKLKMMNYSKVTSIIVGDEVFDIEYLNSNSDAQAKLIEYINAGNEVYIKLDNNTIVNLEGEVIKLKY